jgi:hypothetical protein
MAAWNVPICLSRSGVEDPVADGIGFQDGRQIDLGLGIPEHDAATGIDDAAIEQAGEALPCSSSAALPHEALDAVRHEDVVVVDARDEAPGGRFDGQVAGRAGALRLFVVDQPDLDAAGQGAHIVAGAIGGTVETTISSSCRYDWPAPN